MKYLFLVFIFFYCHIDSFTQQKLNEGQYSDYIQQLLGGEREYSIQSGRVDLVTSSHAFEIEYARKWKQAIGQSIWYGLQTNKKPGIILLILDKKDYKYFIQLNSALEYSNLQDQIEVFIFPQDFESLINEESEKK